MIVRTLLIAAAAAAALLLGPRPASATEGGEAEQVVRAFLAEVRSGRNPDAASLYFAEQVQAHQVTAEGPTTIVRSPADYAAHVREFLAAFGPFTLAVEEFIAGGDRVFVRWRQEGRHLASLAGEAPTGVPLIELTSVVYRVENGRIAEYWLQTDRKGLELQLRQLEH